MSAKSLFNYVALALGAGALLHVVGLALGPEAVKFLGAPPDVVQSVAEKTLYGPAITLAIAGLLAGLGILSARAARHAKIGKISRFMLWLFAFIFTVRGLLVFIFVPAVMSGSLGDDWVKLWFHAGASIFVLTIGLALGFALYKTRRAVT